MGIAPVITDGDSGAGRIWERIMDYIIAKYGDGSGRLIVQGLILRGFADYLFWYHFANGTMLPERHAGDDLSRVLMPRRSARIRPSARR